MPQTTQELIELLDLKRVNATTFVGSDPKTLLQRTYGGQVLSQALTAAYNTVPQDRVAHSLHAYFLRPGLAAEKITYFVEALRDGGTFSSRRVSAEQGGRELFVLSSSFHPLEDSKIEHADPRPEVAQIPSDFPKLSEVMDARFGRQDLWHEHDALDIRFVGDSSAAGSLPALDRAGRMQVWVKTADSLPDDIRLHQAVLSYLSDLTLLSVSTVPHPVVFMSNQLQIASVDHAIWFHRPCRVDDWLLYDMNSPSASHALGFSTGRLFQGQDLVASCAQEGLVRQVANRPILT